MFLFALVYIFIKIQKWSDSSSPKKWPPDNNFSHAICNRYQITFRSDLPKTGCKIQSSLRMPSVHKVFFWESIGYFVCCLVSEHLIQEIITFSFG